MKPTPKELKAHIATDPNHIGLSWSKGDGDLAVLFRLPDYGDCRESVLSKDAFIEAILPAVLRLGSASPELQAKWDRPLALLNAVQGTLDIDRPAIAGVLAALVADDLMTVEEQAAIGVRKGTYSEAQFGAGIQVNSDDIAGHVSMANKILVPVIDGTPKQICFRDVTDFNPAAANDLRIATPTEVQLDMTDVANTGWRQSTKADLGAVRSELYEMEAALEFAATPVAGEYVDLYAAWSESATAGNANPGGVSGADSAYTGYSANAAASAKQLDPIGRLVVTAQATGTIQVIKPGLQFRALARYVTLVVDQESDAAMHSDAVETHIVFNPVFPQVQNAT